MDRSHFVVTFLVDMFNFATGSVRMFLFSDCVQRNFLDKVSASFINEIAMLVFLCVVFTEVISFNELFRRN